MKIKQKLMATFFPLVLVPLILLQIVAGYFLSLQTDDKIEVSMQRFGEVVQLLATDNALRDYISSLSYDMQEEAQVALGNLKKDIRNYFSQSPVYEHVFFFDPGGKEMFLVSSEQNKKIADKDELLAETKNLAKGVIHQSTQGEHLVMMTEAYNDVDEYIGVLGLMLDEYGAVGEIKNHLYKIYLTMGVFTLVTLLLVVIITLYISRRITEPIIETNRILEDIATGEGDLSRRLEVKTNDEIGQMAGWFNNFSHQIFNIIKQVKEVSDAIHRFAAIISEKSEGLYSSTSRQSQAISSTLSTLENFNSVVKMNADSAGEANAVLESFNVELQEKKDLVDNVTGTMTEINRSGEQIDNIINVINDISFQTNLLALNAAVEAARAGEAGRGFAVVASEVRNLAQKTAESSKTIQEIVSTNVTSTKKGMELVNRTSEFFTSIFEVITKIVDNTRQIDQSTTVQSEGVEQINQSVNDIDSLISHIVELVKELNESGKDLRDNADKLQKLVEMFKL